MEGGRERGREGGRVKLDSNTQSKEMFDTMTSVVYIFV